MLTCKIHIKSNSDVQFRSKVSFQILLSVHLMSFGIARSHGCHKSHDIWFKQYFLFDTSQDILWKYIVEVGSDIKL